MAILKALSSKRSVMSIQKYVLQERKTNSDLVRGYDVDGMDFGEQFEQVQELYDKTDGRRYYHYILSFPKDESERMTPEEVNDMGYTMAEDVFGKKGYQFVVVTHTDRDHLHDHIIVNSVNAENGKKLHTSAKDLQQMKHKVNVLCQRRGLEPIAKEGQKITNGEYWVEKRQEKTGIEPWKKELRDVISLARSKAASYDEFKDILKEWDVTVTRDNGKGMTYIHPNGKKVRGKKLGPTYDKAFIVASFEPQDLRPKAPKKVRIGHRSHSSRIGATHTRASRTSGLAQIIKGAATTSNATYSHRNTVRDEENDTKDKLKQVEEELYRGW